MVFLAVFFELLMKVLLTGEVGYIGSHTEATEKVLIYNAGSCNYLCE